jgi:hypothetical protein
VPMTGSYVGDLVASIDAMGNPWNGRRTGACSR